MRFPFRRFLLIAVLCAGPAYFGCKTVPASQGASSAQALSRFDTADGLGEVACGEAVYQSFKLVPAKIERAKLKELVALLDLPKSPDGRRASIILGPSSSLSMRFDTCVTADSPFDRIELKRLIMLGFGGSPFTVLTVEQGAVIEGLAAAVFAEDYESLRITLPARKEISAGGSEQTSDRIVVIKGYGKGEQGFMACVNAVDKGERLELESSLGLAGRVEAGDPIAKGSCPPGLAEQHVAFSLNETVRMEAQTCTGIGTSGTHAYQIETVTVKDSSDALPEDIRGKTFEVKRKDTGERNYRFDVRHHNVCDWFVLTLPHAKYAITSDMRGHGGGVCSEIDPEAPPPAGIGAQYRITYGNKRPIEGSMGDKCGNAFSWCAQ